MTPLLNPKPCAAGPRTRTCVRAAGSLSCSRPSRCSRTTASRAHRSSRRAAHRRLELLLAPLRAARRRRAWQLGMGMWSREKGPRWGVGMGLWSSGAVEMGRGARWALLVWAIGGRRCNKAAGRRSEVVAFFGFAVASVFWLMEPKPNAEILTHKNRNQNQKSKKPRFRFGLARFDLVFGLRLKCA